MKKILAILVVLLFVCSMSCAFAYSWQEAVTDKCAEYAVDVTKYAKVNSDVGAAYEKAPNATAKVGDTVYFALSAIDAAGEPVDAEVEYHHLGNIEQVGKLHKAIVVGTEPWVKISITEKTAMTDLVYKGAPIVVNGASVSIGSLTFTRNAAGTVTDVTSNLNTAEMLDELAQLGIDIQALYEGKVCMTDDTLIQNFGKICATSDTASWYVAEDKPALSIPKTGDAPGMISFTAISAASLFGIGKVYAMACKKGRKGGKGGRGGGC